jgi:hypothetical protein
MGTSFADRCKSDIANGVPIAKEALTGESQRLLLVLRENEGSNTGKEGGSVKGGVKGGGMRLS